MLGLSALAKGSSDDNSCVEVTAHRGSSGRVHFADRGVRLSARGAWQCNSQGSRTDWLTSQKRRTKPAATGNKRLSDQTRKILGKHHCEQISWVVVAIAWKPNNCARMRLFNNGIRTRNQLGGHLNSQLLGRRD